MKHTLHDDAASIVGKYKLVDLHLQLYRVLPPRGRDPLSTPSLGGTPEERGLADRRRKTEIALEIAWWRL
ncbi:hypothetical protein BAE44_0015241 [Dichanthelium oligosanthes]|uniref:Uncharacterized protein n=1 Tax=Dichanthelium oligosanthes TaxID=888268 RepID=A0A1E5VF24_9POAL|nr:hypothetical protein BAE44_0015241 [Dichanthelium oligosanthes]